MSQEYKVEPKSLADTALVAVDPKPEEPVPVPELETKEVPNGETTASPEK